MQGHMDPLNGRRQVVRCRLKGIERDELSLLNGSRLLCCLVPVSHSLAATWHFGLDFEGGLFLTLSTEPVSTGGWEELGCLVIDATVRTTMIAKQREIAFQEWPLANFVIQRSEMLVFEDEAWLIESGIAFLSTDGRQVVVAPGVPPGSVSVALETLTSTFDPEMPIEDYRRCPIEPHST